MKLRDINDKSDKLTPESNAAANSGKAFFDDPRRGKKYNVDWGAGKDADQLCVNFLRGGRIDQSVVTEHTADSWGEAGSEAGEVDLVADGQFRTVGAGGNVDGMVSFLTGGRLVKPMDSHRTEGRQEATNGSGRSVLGRIGEAKKNLVNRIEGGLPQTRESAGTRVVVHGSLGPVKNILL